MCTWHDVIMELELELELECMHAQDGIAITANIGKLHVSTTGRCELISTQGMPCLHG